jgi:hypothetical protein
MTAKIRLAKRMVLLAACTLALGAAGCSMGDVQFNGGIFDMVGLSDSAKAKTSTGDPKLAARPPLVVPPALDRLPQPGEAQAEATQEAKLEALHDPDVGKQKSRQELEQQQAAYCREHYEIPKQRGDDSADGAEGPLGPCRPSVLNAIKQWNSADE